ncbi:unnamed protein product, partial [Brenthis ino]
MTARNLSSEPEDNGMRRAISLSDLAAKPVPAPRAPQAPSKPAQQNNANTTKSPSGFVRPAPRYNTKSNMTRSSSVGVLNNQSDSESDPQPPRQLPRAQGLMRPTISSANKAAANTVRRRNVTSNNYTQARSESSSETEDTQRPRAASVDRAQRRLGRSGSERDISAKAREVTARLTANTRQRQTKQETTGDSNLTSSQLCSALTEQLTKTASKVVQLYRKLQSDPDCTDDIVGLEAAILQTQKVLKSAGDFPLVQERAGEHVTPKESPPNPAMSLIEQYSDILLNMMQSKMVNQFSQSPQSLPPNTREDS